MLDEQHKRDGGDDQDTVQAPGGQRDAGQPDPGGLKHGREVHIAERHRHQIAHDDADEHGDHLQEALEPAGGDNGGDERDETDETAYGVEGLGCPTVEHHGVYGRCRKAHADHHDDASSDNRRKHLVDPARTDGFNYPCADNHYQTCRNDAAQGATYAIGRHNDGHRGNEAKRHAEITGYPIAGANQVDDGADAGAKHRERRIEPHDHGGDNGAATNECHQMLQGIQQGFPQRYLIRDCVSAVFSHDLFLLFVFLRPHSRRALLPGRTPKKSYRRCAVKICGHRNHAELPTAGTLPPIPGAT